MSLKRSAVDAGIALEDAKDDIDNRVKLTDLPVEALALITTLSFDINSPDDINNMLQLANPSKALTMALGRWKCSYCKGKQFFTVDGDTDRLIVREGSEPYQCVTCGEKYCGHQPSCQRKPGECNECEELECWPCTRKHMENCPDCLQYDFHCNGCQGECTQGCNLCGFSVCDKHVRKCDTCGIQTCGIHDFKVDYCSYCDKGFCPRCHNHGDMMHSCYHCGKKSCMKGDCDQFHFYDFAVCTECKANVCQSSSSEEYWDDSDEDEEDGSGDEKEDGSDDDEDSAATEPLLPFHKHTRCEEEDGEGGDDNASGDGKKEEQRDDGADSATTEPLRRHARCSIS